MNQYTANNPKTHARGKTPKIYQSNQGEWKLTTFEKKKILLNNIYGVDIDTQAVEVTKLSLLLKVLESETEGSLQSQLKLFHERALPDLGNNIKCGNSLIGSNYYEGRLTTIFDEEEMYKVNAFNWEKEFEQIIKAGGFDVVIGNPPWGADFSEQEKPYLEQNYILNSGKHESYIYFIEHGTKLLRDKGLFGFIVPSYWVSRSQTENLRKYLFEKMRPNSFVVLPENVFSGVKMDSSIIVVENDPVHATKNKVIKIGEIASNQLFDCLKPDGLERMLGRVTVNDWKKHNRFRFNPRISKDNSKIILTVERNTFQLGTIVEVSQGLTLYRRSTLAEIHGKTKAEQIVNKRLFHSNHKKDSTYKKELLGRDISRYLVSWNGKSWVSYGPWLAHAVDERFFKGPRLVVQKLRNPMLKQRLVAGYLDDNETYSAGVLLNIIPIKSKSYSLLYVLGLINSKLLNYWYRKNILDLSIRVVDLKQLPIRTINFSNAKDKSQHDKMLSLVDRMLELNKQLIKTKILHGQTLLKRQIDATDRQIDQLVYHLYGLTEKEIKIVEGE